MTKAKPTYKRQSILGSAIAVSAVFVAIGPVVSESLIDYGFEIFSPSVSENLAILAAGAISFPASAFFESIPVSRFWMAVNGAFWGVVGYLVLVNTARFLNRGRTKQS